jgi:hypothetical protein
MPNFRTGVPTLDPEGVDVSTKTVYTAPMAFTNTAQQDQAIAAYKTGGNVLLRAGAGTGKTSTLRLMAGSDLSKSVLFIAFNVSVKEAAEKSFPSNTLSLTSAGLANRALRASGKAWLVERMVCNKPTSPFDISKFLKMPFQHVIEGNDGEATVFQGWQLASAAVRMVENFSHSADLDVQAYHCPRYDKLTKSQHKSLQVFLLPFARKVWADINSQTGVLKFRQAHDLYFKVWSLTNPVLDFDAVFVDEAQDTNPALAAVIANQTTQIVMVGDESQAIYAWRGAIDALSSFNADHTVNLSQSFRFGTGVAEVANRFLDRLNAPLRIEGVGPESTVGPLSAPDAILCRTNAGAIEAAISQLEAGRKVALVGKMASEIKSFVDAAEKLMNGKRVQHADLAAFKTWQEVVEFAGSDEGRELRMIVSLVTKYGIEGLRGIVSQTVNPEDADVTISTAHKAKGLEWGSVMIWGDFKVKTEEGEEISTAELMLMYVAVTRAMRELDPGILGMI